MSNHLALQAPPSEVLIVGGELRQRVELAEVLCARGHRAAHVTGVDRALEHVERFATELVIADVSAGTVDLERLCAGFVRVDTRPSLFRTSTCF